jgi:hypothetical protein
MTIQDCKSLEDHLAARADAGVVNVKFFVQPGSMVGVEKLCTEASRIFDAIGRGAFEPYEPKS